MAAKKWLDKLANTNEAAGVKCHHVSNNAPRNISDFDAETNLPKRISVLHDEEPAAEITIKSWTLNDSLTPELFERPDVPEEKERDP